MRYVFGDKEYKIQKLMANPCTEMLPVGYYTNLKHYCYGYFDSPDYINVDSMCDIYLDDKLLLDKVLILQVDNHGTGYRYIYGQSLQGRALRNGRD